MGIWIVAAIIYVLIKFILPAIDAQKAQTQKRERENKANNPNPNTSYGKPYSAFGDKWDNNKPPSPKEQWAAAFEEGSSTMWKKEKAGNKKANMGKAPIDTTINTTVSSTIKPTMGRRHELEASALTGHAHTEFNESAEECPAAFTDNAMAAIDSEKSCTGGVSSLDALLAKDDTIINGIILSEVLGKPKALKGRL